MARLSNAFLQYLDDAGKPIPEGKLYFYDSGTTNLRNTYVDSGLSIPNANPLLLDGAGRVNSPFLDGNYRVILTDKDDNQIREIDPVQGSLSDSQWADWSITTTYGITDIVRASNGKYYISLTGSNIGNDPVSSSTNWSQVSFVNVWNINETYSMDDNVFESGTQYKSLVDSNLGNLPSTSPAEWGVPTGGVVAGNPVSVLTNDVPYLEAGNDLSDVADAPTARTNLVLGNVNNTSDLDKPVSTATQTALDLKLTASSNLSDVGSAATSRSNLDVYSTSEVDSLTTKSWVSKWTGSSTLVTNSWGVGEFLLRSTAGYAKVTVTGETVINLDGGNNIQISGTSWTSMYNSSTLKFQIQFHSSSSAGLQNILEVLKAE